MQISELQAFVLDKIEDMKARDIQVVDVKGKSPVTDLMIVCTGTSKTHVKSISNHLYLEAKRHEVYVMGIEGTEDSEWVLVDMGDVVVHIMQQQTRDLYQLEQLWQSAGA
ncbi:ribosome silencing factor [Moritella sp. 24]|uniref:ribosome silencing factor n=1 Tax=Moritella sp. 24 TaxID=2746230 RepID=UPI001BA94306|nr:ribosome silencing factor [Moritella sp. 24]QUM75317.1 ribosome silencing factor [Moritella sp. 24]